MVILYTVHLGICSFFFSIFVHLKLRNILYKFSLTHKTWPLKPRSPYEQVKCGVIMCFISVLLEEKCIIQMHTNNTFLPSEIGLKNIITPRVFWPVLSEGGLNM